MLVSKSDKINADNLIKFLKRAKVELTGAEEVLATAEMMKWFSGLNSRIDKALKDQEDLQKAQQAALVAKPVESLSEKAPEKKSKQKKG